jgi:2-oxoisovalerate dehydrogenase E1 component
MSTLSVPIAGLARQKLVDLYRRMQLVRKCELRLAKSHQQGLIHGACHTYVGQEATAVGVISQLDAEDVVFSTHRGHGHALAKGVTAEQLIAELYGRVTGCSRGRGGSMHLFAPEVGMMGTSGIVGPCILHSTGAAYSFKVLQQSRVAVAFFGEGAVSNGAFHEGLNMASVWKLPVVFVCENNQYATEVSFSRAAGNPHVANRGVAYGLPGVEVDGNDIQAVCAAAATAIERARNGQGPTIIECKTYRTRPHAEGMVDVGYRTREEVASWKDRCPIEKLRKVLVDCFADEMSVTDELDVIDEQIASEIEAAHRAALGAEYPESVSAATHVYAEEAATVGSVSAPSGPTHSVTFTEATVEALDHAMQRDPSVFVMGEGIGPRGGNFRTTAGLLEKYGESRLCDTPISERGFVGMSAGAAMTGTRPVIDFMFADFILDAVGEILNQIAKVQYMSNGRLQMPVVLRGCIGIGHSAATHHSGSYYPMYAHFPGLRVVVPSRPYDAKGLFATALRSNDPVIFLEHRELLTLREEVPQDYYEIPFGKAAVVREGTDVTIVALAQILHRSIKAADALERDGISVEVIDPRTVAPLDATTILTSVSKTGRLLIVDETFAPFGLGAEIAAQVIETGFDELDAPIRRLHGAHTPTPYSPILETAVVPQVEDIVRSVKELFSE